MSLDIPIWMVPIGLSIAEQQSVSLAAERFCEFFPDLTRGAEARLRIAPTHPCLADELESMSAEDDFGWLQATVAIHAGEGTGLQPGQRFVWPKVLILSDRSARPAQAALEREPSALWGLAEKPGNLALAYGPRDERLIWHELLHLFGADDCYRLPDEGPTCTEPDCVMQYDPTRSRSDECIVICGANRRVIEAQLQRLAGAGA